MRGLLVTLLMLTLCSAALPQVATLAEGRQDTSIAKQADDFLSSRDFSGVVLVARDGRLLFEKAYGMANREHDVPNKLETKFRLGSLTKQFTALAVMILVERGQVRVEDPICKYIDNCPKAWNAITLRHLLTHTSGIPNFTESYDRLPMTPLATIALFRDKSLEFAPGERWSYSNSGYLLLGYIIERTSGERYEDFLRKNIYQPLGMLDSGYDHPRTILKDRASGYSREKGELLNAMFMEMDTPFGGGSMYSTVGDLLRWDQALYTDKLVSRKSLAQIFTPFQGSYPVAPRNRRFGYGYGWFIMKSFGHDLITHTGGIRGFCSAIMRYPEDRTLVIVLENMEPEEKEGDPELVEPLVVANGLSAIAFGLPPNTDSVSGVH